MQDRLRPNRKPDAEKEMRSREWRLPLLRLK
jgi:hypothetical protein